jgi:hypothetical protein
VGTRRPLRWPRPSLPDRSAPARAPPGLLTYDKADRILVVNTNDWMPSGLDLTLDRAEIGRGEVTLRFSAGQFDLGRFLG